jgi:hypothetical protein
MQQYKLKQKDLKVGMQVRVKTREEFKREYPHLYIDEGMGKFTVGVPHSFISLMNGYSGKIYTIKELPSYFGGSYKLKEIGWNWSVEMFTLALTKRGNKIICRN